MSTSVVHVLTIIGKASQEVEAACRDLLGRRVARSPNGYGSDDWSAQDHHDIESFCVRLIGAAYELPVLYYAQYIDAWSVADSRYRLVDWPDGQRLQVYGSGYGLVFYPSQHRESFLSQIKKRRQTKVYRQQTEDRWYLDHLSEAIQAAGWLPTPFLVISISRCLGGSRYDEEIKAALDLPIGRGAGENLGV
jgi:hypothetical protein